MLAISLQKAGHTLSNGMGKLGEFVVRRRLDAAKQLGGFVDTVDIDTIQKQHVEMDIQIILGFPRPSHPLWPA
jgi:hypothetical protein